MIDLKEARTFRITDFSGGLNKWASSYNVRNNELIEADNIDLHIAGSVKTRKGSRFYADMNYGDPISTPIIGGTRYCKTDGTRQIVLAQGSSGGAKIYRDNGDGKFDHIDTLIQSDDYLSFAQWQDTIIYGTRKNLTTVYQAGESPETLIPMTSGYLGFHGMLANNPFVAASRMGGNLEKPYHYIYRFTFDIKMGDDFLAETSPLAIKRTTLPKGNIQQEYSETEGKTFTAGGGDPDYRTIVLLKMFNASPTLPSYVDGINVYRTPAQGPTLLYDDEHGYDPDPNFYWIGYITASTYNAAGTADIVFEDRGYGQYITEKQINYDILTQPPRAKFYLVHKNRLWYANLITPDLATGEEYNEPWRIYVSEYAMPLSVRYSSWLDINSHDGEEITGWVSWRNRAVIIFKENSMWGIQGFDEEKIEGVPSFQMELIDNAVGCIAPHSIVVAEGRVIWLSNKGVYYYDGSAPKSLKTEFINPILDAIPNPQKRLIAGAYFHDRRQCWLAIPHKEAPAVEKHFHRKALVFDSYTGSWSVKSFYPGIGMFLQAMRGDESRRIFYGAYDNAAIVLTRSAVVEIETNSADQISTSMPVSSLIEWKFQTKFYDCGYPEVDKDFLALLVRARTTSDMTVHIICDGRKDTRDNASGKTISPTVPSGGLVWGTGKWAEASWAKGISGDRLVYLDSSLWGKRVSLEFSGTSSSDTEIEAVTIFYKPREGVRQ